MKHNADRGRPTAAIAEDSADVCTPRVAPGNSWVRMASAPADIEPENKIAALRVIASGIPKDLPYRSWFLRAISNWAVTTGSSLEFCLGLKRSGKPAPHRVDFLDARDQALRYIAHHMPSSTEIAAQIVAIIHDDASAPSPRVADLVEDVKKRFPGEIPTSDRQMRRILGGDEDPT